MDIVSIVSGIASIVLAIYAIHYAKGESKRSQENYLKTQDLIKEIDHKSSQIDRGIQFEQQFLLQIINKLLNQEGKSPITMQPISLKEIDSIIEGKTAEAKKRIEELENIIDQAPRIFVQKDEPTDSKDGDIWLKLE